MSKAELESYKKEVLQLEAYLIECTNLFSGYVKDTSGDVTHVPFTLKGCIESILSYKGKPEPTGNYVAGQTEAYRDCIQLLTEIADDTEHHLAGNDKAMKLAMAYRQLADGIQERMNIVQTGIQR